ncbi:MAG: hypothetical protein HZB26_17785 [Candidatus Hydrogenedentes bacterium]|nr:hypothetical protein [Candidatus Hydrogenedentota bacterium]
MRVLSFVRVGGPILTKSGSNCNTVLYSSASPVSSRLERVRKNEGAMRYNAGVLFIPLKEYQ